MKVFLIIFFTLIFFSGYSQKTTAQILSDIEQKVSPAKPVLNSDLKVILKDITTMKEMLSQPAPVNSNFNFVGKGQFYSFPFDKQGGLSKSVKLEFVKLQNAATYEVVVSKFSDLHSATNYISNSRILQLTGLDTNQVYYYKHRGKNPVFTGEWSEVKRFDTRPLTFLKTSFYDLKEYDPLVSYLGCMVCFNTVYQKVLPSNITYQTEFKTNDKQIFVRVFEGNVTSFPYQLNSSSLLFSQVIKVENVGSYNAIINYPAWTNKQKEDFLITPYLSFSNGIESVNYPAGLLFPLSSIDIFVAIYFTKE